MFEKIKVTKEFIQKNNLTLNRSQNDILERITVAEESDFFGFQREILTDHLDLAEEGSHKFFKDEYVAKIKNGEKKPPKPPTLKRSVQNFLDYMVFAWGKALDERGISAGRSIVKLGEYLWLFNRDDLYEIIHDDNLYPMYGRHALRVVCEKMGIPAPEEL